ncbi:MAG TPA: TonB-dependent receptor [Rhodanobacteraceae bacterium]
MNCRTRPTRRVLTTCLLLALGAGSTAYAQSITGNLAGKVPAGQALTIQVVGQQSGQERTLAPNANGRYSTTGLNPGRYIVNIIQDGTTVATRSVTVSPNTTVTVAPYAAPSAQLSAAEQHAEKLSAVTVSANAMNTDVTPIDVSTPELVSNFSMQLVNQLPVGRSPQSIALLQSNVTYDDQTTGSVMMGGATPAENRYFINGFDTTDDDTSIGGHAFPPEAVANTTVISDGFGASWTNATGGVMASTIRQGTNKFKAGYSVYFTPPTSRLLEPRGHDVVNANGDYYRFASQNSHSSSFTQYLWASGAIVKNRLFFFGLLGNVPPTRSTGVGMQSMSIGGSREKQAMLNITWNITDNQSLNIFGEKDWSSSSTNSYQLNQPYDRNAKGAYIGWSGGITNQHFLVGNYHYNITDNLSLVLMGGYVAETTGSVLHGQYIDQPYVESVDPNTQVATLLSNNNIFTYGPPRAFDKHGFTGKLNWDIGPNRITVGGEMYKHQVTEEWGYNPHGVWIYYDRPGAVLGNGYTVPGNGQYVQEDFHHVGGTVPTDSKAAYLQDFWNVTDNVVLYGAVRDDQYSYKNTQDKTFIHFNKISPRAGVSWDVHGDSTLKIGANIGKYAQQLPSNFTFGMADVEYVAQNYYTYTGMDPTTKAPTGTQQIGPTNVQDNGLPPTPDSIAVKNLKSNSQLEGNIYAQQQFSSGWTGMVEFSYSKLLRDINETCDYQKIDAYAHSHGFAGYNMEDQSGNCIEYNPGSSLDIAIPAVANGGTAGLLHIPDSHYGVPGAKRKYYRLTLQMTHQRTADQPYYLNLSYTWAHEYGNDNGLLDLQRGDPGYIGQTPEFDYPEMTVGGTGDLNQDIRHSFVASGVYYFPNHLNIGAVLSAHTGQPLSCFGTYTIDPTSYVAQNYGASTYVCDGKVVPLGSAGRLPFFWSLNLSAGYDWHITPKNDLQFNLQIYNVTNRRGVVNRNQTWDQGFIPASGMPPLNVNYGLPAYQAPRTTSINLRYTWG